MAGELLGGRRHGCARAGRRRRRCWTARSPSGSPARSRACASSGAAPGAAARAWRCRGRARTRSTSTSCRHPDEALLGRADEAAILDPTNPEIRIGHLLRGAARLPLVPGDDACSVPVALEAARGARGGRRAASDARRSAWRGAETRPPAPSSLRSASTDCDRGGGAAERRAARHARAARAFSTVHEGAVYLHRGEPTTSTRSISPRAWRCVEPFDGAWYTQPKRETETSIVRADRAREPLRRRRSPSARRGTSRWSPTSAGLCRSTPRSTRGARPARASGSRPEALWFEPPDELLEARPAATCSAPCTPPSTRRSRCCRCSRCATAGTSAASRRTSTRRPASRRCSSTTATPAASASRSAATRASSELVGDAHAR